MENEITPTVSPSPMNPPVEKPQFKEQTIPSRKPFYIIVAILLFIILGLIGYIGWNYLQTESTSTRDTTINSETEELPESSTEAEEEETEETTQPEEPQCETGNVKYDENELFSFCYPSTWEIRVGNTHAPNFPEDTIVVASSSNSADISIIVDSNDLDIPIGDAVLNFIERTSGSFEFPEPETVSVGGDTGARLDFYVTSVADTSNYEKYVAVRHDNTNLYVRTQFAESLMSGEIIPADAERVIVYEQLIESILFND